MGAPVDETFHFGRVLDTVTLLNQLGIGAEGSQLRAEFHQANPIYVPQNGLPYSIFNDYWQSIGVYAIHALVQWAVPGLSLLQRLYLARFVNVCFEAVLIGLAYAAFASVFRNRRIALLLAGLLSFIPTLGSSAATLTTEVPAFAACLVLFNALIYRHESGWSIKTILWLLAGTLACLLTKNTSWPVIGVVIFMSLRSAGVSWRVVLAGVLLLGIGAATQFKPQGAAHWYRYYLSWEAWSGIDTGLAPVDSQISQLGHNSLMLAGVPADRPLIQHLPEASLASLRGKVVTVGSWVHAPAGTSILLPVFQESVRGGYFSTVPQAEVVMTASGDWQFAHYQVVFPPGLDYARVALWQTPGTQTPVWYDGLVMVAAEFPEASQPHFSNEDAAQGVWNDQPFVNVLQNASAERQWWGVESSRWTIEFPVNQRLIALQDGTRTTGAYFTAARAMFATLWGSFQNDIPGLRRWHLAVLGLVLATGFVSGLFHGLRLSPGSLQQPLRVWVLECWLVWLVVYAAMGLLRADISGAWVDPYFYATGRFIIPALFPLLGFTWAGLSKLLPPPQRNRILAGLLAVMFLLNIWMMLKVESPYYQCQTSPRWSCIAMLQ